MIRHPCRPVSRVALAATLIVCLLGARAHACDTSATAPQEMSAKLASCVTRLEADVEQLAKQVAALQALVGQAREADDIVTVRAVKLDDPPKANPSPLTGGLVQCPRGSWVSGIEVTVAGTGREPMIQQQPARQLRYSCRALK